MAVDLSNIDATALFANLDDLDGLDDKWLTTDDGLIPVENSAIHNTGDNNEALTIPADIKGNARIQGDVIDIGAYEYGEETLEIDGLSNFPGLVIYPNPLSSRKGKSILGYLTNPESNPKQLVIRDMGGKLVHNIPIEDSTQAIELGDLSAGTYLAILSFEQGKRSHSFKVLVE